MKTKTIIFIIFIIFLSTGIFASGDGNGEHGFNWNAFLGRVLNSTLLFGGLFLLLRKPVSKMLAEKTLDIRTDIQKREDTLEHESSRFEDLLKRLEEIEREVAVMKEQAREDGRIEIQRLEELGRVESEKILQLTQEEIRNKMDTALRNLKARIAQLAIDRFKDDINSKLTKEMHQKIIEKNIEICGDIIENE